MTPFDGEFPEIDDPRLPRRRYFDPLHAGYEHYLRLDQESER